MFSFTWQNEVLTSIIISCKEINLLTSIACHQAMTAEIRSLVSNIVKLSYISIVVEHFGVFYLWIEYVVAVDMYALRFSLGPFFTRAAATPRGCFWEVGMTSFISNIMMVPRADRSTFCNNL